MISNEEFIRQSIESNLIYCGSMLEFTYSLGFSFLAKDIDITNEIKRFYDSFKKQMIETINIANRNIKEELIDSNILYTKYTIPLYELAEDITGNKADIDIIKKLITLKPGIPVVSEDLLNKVKNINQNTLNLLKEYTDFNTYLNNQVSSLNLFVFKYGMYLEDVKNRSIFYYENLSRIMNKEKVSVILIDKNIEEIKNLMERNALFINGFINQSEDNIITEARNFADEFNQLDLSNTSKLSEAQTKVIYNKAYTLINSFIEFITSLIEKILNRSIQFMVGPAYLDICLREANAFKYNLTTLL